jgi:glucose dehydrogenase
MALLAANVVALAWSCDTVADEWPWYGHDPGGTRYSPLTQINRENVSTLRNELRGEDFSQRRG